MPENITILPEKQKSRCWGMIKKIKAVTILDYSLKIFLVAMQGFEPRTLRI
jgi:hypothetical protein